MNGLIDAAFSRARVVLLLLVALLVVGSIAYVAIPKESSPEIPIPFFYVSTGLEGISPEDAERLLVEPLEAELGELTGLKTLTGTAGEGYASVQLEFDPGFDADQALDDVRAAVDRAGAELPVDANEPTVTEINTALFPILTAILSGPVPERTLNRLAERLQEDIEALPGVLEVDIGGRRTELLEVLIDPTVFETYNLTLEELVGSISRNNRLIAAGAIEAGAGRLVLKVPGLIEDATDVLDLPVLVRGDTVVTFDEVATVRRTFTDPAGFARINGQPALALEIKKRVGANIIETVAAVRATIAETSADWPDSVRVLYTQDESEQVRTVLADLEANVIAAVVLVMIVIVYALGVRPAVLVGLAIPGAFLSGVAALWAMDYTLNIVVLFSLILVVGMLVDGAIVTVELADRYLAEGAAPPDAYARAAKRMAWPIVASTATTLSVFFPLLFWQGVVGEFMKFLPLTVILTLTASLFMALVFIPVLGGLIGKRQPQSAAERARLHAAESGDPRRLGGISGAYARLLERAVLNPSTTLALAVLGLVIAFTAYARYGNGVSFFPQVEPDFAQVEVRARDNLSTREQDALVRQVETLLLDLPEVRSVYARSGGSERSDADLIGTVQLEFVDWDERRTAEAIVADIREDVAVLPGIDVQVRVQSNSPSQGKPVNLRLASRDLDAMTDAVTRVRDAMQALGGFSDVTDSRALPGVEWQLDVDRTEAARFGADVTLLGQAVQLLTQGITVAEYRPDDTEGSVDIRVRFPSDARTLERLESLRVPTSAGLVPIANFVDFSPAPRSGAITRIDQRRVTTIEANVAPGRLVSERIAALEQALETMDLPDSVDWSFAGEAEDQRESMVFLAGAFGAAIALMFIVLLVQFDSYRQALIVMSAIAFSIAGVLLGLLVTGRPFGIVMGGIGVIALAGIVVNNNIVLIDTYNALKRDGLAPLEAALRTGCQRLRPVVLTSVTTALGLLPMVIGVNLDFVERRIVFGAPSTQWWTELSSAIAGGLVVATVLTLVVTPAMLMLAEGGAARRRVAAGGGGRHERWSLRRGSVSAETQTAP